MSKTTPWYETLFSGLYAEVLGGDPHTVRAAEQARLVKHLLRLRSGQRALDVPCGQGRITRHSRRLIAVATRPKS